MRLKELFTIPEGERVTEKMFARVLVSSVCSILLCMACLFGTTWAWFVVSIENTGNVIQTADAPKYILQVNGQEFTSGNNLSDGTHTVCVAHASDADDLQKKSKLYVTFTLGSEPYGYIILGGDHADAVTITVKTETELSFSWAVSWFAPGNPDVNLLSDHIIQITAENPAEESTGASDPTEESTEASDPTEESTGASDPTEESTEASDPTEESTKASDPTEESTEASDPTEESTEATDPTEASDPTEESTTATDI